MHMYAVLSVHMSDIQVLQYSVYDRFWNKHAYMLRVSECVQCEHSETNITVFKNCSSVLKLEGRETEQPTLNVSISFACNLFPELFIWIFLLSRHQWWLSQPRETFQPQTKDPDYSEDVLAS